MTGKILIYENKLKNFNTDFRKTMIIVTILMILWIAISIILFVFWEEEDFIIDNIWIKLLSVFPISMGVILIFTILIALLPIIAVGLLVLWIINKLEYKK